MKQDGADILRLWVVGVRLFRGSAHRPGDPEVPGRCLSPPAQHAALSAGRARRLHRGRARRARGHAGAGALGAAPPGRARCARCARLSPTYRLPRAVHGAAQFLRRRSLGLLFRHPQGRALLRRGRRLAPARRAHRARRVFDCLVALAGAGAVLHRRGGVARAPSATARQRASRASSPTCRQAGATRRWARNGTRIRDAAPRRHRRHRGRARAQKRSAPACRPAPSLVRGPKYAAALDGLDLAEICITSAGTLQRRRRRRQAPSRWPTWPGSASSSALADGREMRALLARPARSR